MKEFKDVLIGEGYVVSGGFYLVKISPEMAVFPDALNVGLIPQCASDITYTVDEFEALPIDNPSQEGFGEIFE